jgi:DNA-binding response OmpR family regulator
MTMSAPARSAVIIEDDEAVRSLLAELLGQAGFAVVEAARGGDGLDEIRRADPDLVTLDLNLPDLDGIEVCKRIREISDAYVVMLTGRSDEIDRLIGLELGADDYLTKPFSPRELRARVGALLRRPRKRDGHEPARSTATLRHLDLEMDVEGRIASLNGRELELTRIEFDLLATLLSGPRRVWTRETLLRRVWGAEWMSDSHLIEVHMGNLRRKLGDDPRTARYVRTVRGVGYRLGTADG